MKLTTNYSLKKPEGSDVVNIDDFNYNADMIDSAIQEIKNTSSTNKTNISSLQTKVNNGQNYKLTGDNGRSLYISNCNLDDIVNCGIYNGTPSGGITNCPSVLNSMEWFFLEVFSHCHATTHCMQKLTTMQRQEPVTMVRIKNGNWSEWREL